MSVEIKIVETKSELKKFTFLHNEHYKNNEFYIPELNAEMEYLFDKKKNPFYENAEAEFFLAYKNGKPVGRITAHIIPEHNTIWNENIGWFGFWITPNDEDIAFGLLDASFRWLKEKGADALRGPANFSYYHDWGLLIHGFTDPNRIIQPYNFYYYKDLLEKYVSTNNEKFEKVVDLLSFYFDIENSKFPERLVKINNRIKKRNKFKIRSLNPKIFDKDVQNIFEISNEVYENNFGTIPIPDKILNNIKDKFRYVCDPDLLLFAENKDGAVIASQMILPDVNEIVNDFKGKLFWPPQNILKFFWRSKIKKTKWCRLWAFGIKEKYRKKGIDSLIYEEALNKLKKLGYKYCDIGWILDCNHSIIKAVKATGAKFYKKHRIYEIKINKKAKTTRPIYSKHSEKLVKEFENN